MKPLLVFSSFLLVGIFSGCSVERQYEVYDDLIVRAATTPSDPNNILYLTQSNHPHGWGRSDCFRCHVFNNIHMQNTTNGAIDDSFLTYARSVGTDTTQCTMCHLDNGATP